MPAAKLNFHIDQGADFQRVLTIRESPVPPATVGAPIDLTGHSFRGQVRQSVGADSVLAQFTFTQADQVTSPGEVTMSLSNTQTSAFPSGPQDGVNKVNQTFVYDVEWIKPNGQVFRILEGKITMSPEVTR